MNYKGMDMNMQCRGFQYEIGKEYETDKAEACECGFHACEYPLDVFSYYSPSTSRFFEVEQSGEISKSDEDSKVASTKIKIVAEISIAGLVKAAIQYTKERCTQEEGKTSSGDQGVASAAGDQGSASATGYQGVASASGKSSSAMASGFNSRVMGEIGCALFLVERGKWNGEYYPIISAKAEIVDGEKIKPGVWYTLKNGEFVEVING